MKNYALITENINNLFVELYKDKDKTTIKQLVKEIKSNKDLQYLYTIVDNLKNGEISPEYVDDFIMENISAAKSKDFSGFDKMLTEGLNAEDELINHIGYILFENKTVFNLPEYTKSYNFVKTHLIERNTWKENLSEQLAECSVIYEQLEQDDKKLFETFLKENREGKLKLYKETKEECIKAINNHIKETTDLSTKVKLYETKDFINSFEDENEVFVENIAKLHDLKKQLLD